MADLTENIARFLDIKVDPRQTTYYRLLGIQDFETDTSVIGSGLKAAFDKLRANKPSDASKDWEQVFKLIQQVQSVLLDPPKKSAYDQKLKGADQANRKPAAATVAPTARPVPPVAAPSSTAKPPTSITASPTASPAVKVVPQVAINPPAVPSPSSPPAVVKPSVPVAAALVTEAPAEVAVMEAPQIATLSSLLPQSDPTAPFDFPGFIREQAIAPVKTESIEDRLDAIKLLLHKDVRRGFGNQAARSSLEGASAVTYPKSPSLSQRARVQKRLSMSSGVLSVLMLVGAGGVVGFGWWMINKPKTRVAQKPPTVEIKPIRPQPVAPAKPNDKSDDNTKSRENRTVASNLPTVGSGDDQGKSAQVTAMLEETQRRMAEEAAQANNLPPAADGDNTISDMPDESMKPEMMENAPDEPASDDAGMMEAATDQPMAGEMPDSTKPMTEAAPELAEDEKKSMAESLANARDSLAKQDFETFHAEMEKALKLSKSPEFKDKYRRLNQLGQLHEQFVQALGDGLKRLKGASELKVGSAIIAIVEVKPDSIVIRHQGMRKEYSLDNIQVALALAIADPALDKTRPIDVAARGVFCLIHPTKTSLNEKQGSKFIEQVIASDEIDDDLLEALTDTY